MGDAAMDMDEGESVKPQRSNVKRESKGRKQAAPAFVEDDDVSCQFCR